MAFFGHRRGNVTTSVINGEDQVGLQWNRLLFPAVGMQSVKLAPVAAAHLAPAAAVQLVPATVLDAAPAPTNHAEPILPAPIDSDSPVPAIQDLGSLGAANEAAGTPAPQAVAAASPSGDLAPPSPPPLLVPSPLTEASAAPAPAPDDAAPPAGHIPRSEAIIWSGPAIMAFPPETHDADGGATASDVADAPDVANAPEIADVPDLADVPDEADMIDAVTRDDLDPVLAAMGSGTDHVAPSDGGGDLSAAFLPPGSSDLGHIPHGLDPGFAFLPHPPVPLPPDFI